MSKKDDAKKLVNDFAARKTGGNLWKTITRKEVADGLLLRIDDPKLINQGKAGLCAPASLLYSLDQDDPVAYAKAGIELWESGQTTIGTLKIKPGSDLLEYKLPATAGINPADWVIMASIRDSENWFFDYQSVDDDGGSSVGEMASWMRKVGYQDVIDEQNRFMASNLYMAQKASDLYAKGYKVLLRINSNMLDEVNPNKGSSRGNHRVALASTITFNLKYGTSPAMRDCFRDYPGPRVCVYKPAETYVERDTSTLSMKVYTWGSVRNVPANGTLTLTGFLDSWYGFVAGKY